MSLLCKFSILENEENISKPLYEIEINYIFWKYVKTHVITNIDDKVLFIWFFIKILILFLKYDIFFVYCDKIRRINVPSA